MTADRLDRIFELQRALQAAMPKHARFGDADVYRDDPDRATALLKETVLAMVSELAELLEWTNWKPWKRPRPDLPDVAKFRVELVDLQHHLVNLYLAWGVTPDLLLALFEAKHRENVDRQRRGY